LLPAGSPSATKALPQILPYIADEDLPSLSEFDSGDFTEIEIALWNQYSGDLNRKAKTDLTLKLQSGLTLNNSNFASGLASSDTSSLNAGLSLLWRSWTIAAGTEIPLGGKDAPLLTFSLGFKPSTGALSKIEKEDDKLTAQREALAVKNAIENWETAVFDMDTERDSLKWRRQERAIQYDLYTELERDMAEYFKRGIISESEYRKAAADKEKAHVNCLLNDTAILIYKINIALYLIEE
jgi:hypothetical protein